MGNPVDAKAFCHVIFTEDGIPAWFGLEPVAGSTPLDLAELRPLLPVQVRDTADWTVWREVLITHFRVDGRWLPRPQAMALVEGGEAEPEVGTEPDPGAEPAAPEEGAEI